MYKTYKNAKFARDCRFTESLAKRHIIVKCREWDLKAWLDGKDGYTGKQIYTLQYTQKYK